MKTSLVGLIVVAVAIGAAVGFMLPHRDTMPITHKWDKVFAKNNNVISHKVKFKNRYGITLVVYAKKYG